MGNSIRGKYNFWGLILHSTPTIAMMVFMATYSVVDGAFVSNYVNTDALSALNIAYPPFCLVMAIGIMLGAGGSALIAKELGEGKTEQAKRDFSLIVYVAVGMGAVITLLTRLNLEPLMRMLGASDGLMQYCLDYSYVVMLFSVPILLEMLFQYLFVTAGKSRLGLFLTVLGGVSNIAFDYIFIVLCDMGIEGAALGTGIGMLIPTGIGLLYFTFARKGDLYFVKPALHIKVLLKSCGNGASEMVTEISNALITLLYNIVMMRYLGADGVAAITILLYSDFLLKSALLGFSMGVSPIISFNYGSQNIAQIKKLFKYCLIFVIGFSATIYTVSFFGGEYLPMLFAQQGTDVYTLAVGGFKLYSISFLFSGFNIFASALFTAFSNGKISAIISFLRTFLFLSAGLIILPPLIGINGAWGAVAIAEGLSALMSLFFLVKYRKTYQYV